MKWTLEAVPELDGYTVEWAENGNYYLSRRNVLFHSSDLKPPFNRIAVIDAPFWRQLASTSRLAQRLLRFMVTNVIALSKDEIFVTFDRSVGVVRKGVYQELKGLLRPCRVLRSACAVDVNGSVFFGEYLDNRERGEMRVYKFSPGEDELLVIFTFPSGSIRHIHGIYFDPFTESLYCLTGDNEKECRILKTNDEFKTTEVIGQGDETWRAVSILFSEDYLYYGMDAEFRSNHVYRLDRMTLNRKSLGEVTGTVFYSKKVGEELFFGTTAENAPSQSENVAALWNVSPNGNCSKINSFQKDHWHQTLFMFGIIHFPYVNKFRNELYFSLIGLNEDNRTFKIRRA
ncbi:MAG: hypothetical protein ACT4O9_15500 [Blastocatellia bacterium]